jgi:hypothetical protein
MSTLIQGADLSERELAHERDAYGPGFYIYQLAQDFHALCCLIGKEAARQELAEVIHHEFDGKRK